MKSKSKRGKKTAVAKLRDRFYKIKASIKPSKEIYEIFGCEHKWEFENGTMQMCCEKCGKVV